SRNLLHPPAGQFLPVPERPGGHGVARLRHLDRFLAPPDERNRRRHGARGGVRRAGVRADVIRAGARPHPCRRRPPAPASRRAGRMRNTPLVGSATLLLMLSTGALAATNPFPVDAPSGTSEGIVYTFTLDSVIHPIAARLVKEAIDSAKDRQARLIIIKLDTPGGLVTSMEEIVKTITSSRVPVVVFVNGSKAASAGFFITIAADVAVMAPGTRIGAAHPVPAVGEIPKDSPMMAKVENDAAAYARTLATNRGRNAAEAEKAVRASRSFTEREALKLGLIDEIAADEAEILRTLDGKTIRRFTGSRETLHLKPTRVVS